MDAKSCIKHGARFPYDAPDTFWNSPGTKPPPAKDAAHAAARGVIADLQDRRGIKHGFDDIDEEVRTHIIESLSQIIREAMKNAD